MIGKLLLIIITILFPPAGVAIIAGCGPDLLINICLTILAYIPGHVHAFYLEYVYYDRREQARHGVLPGELRPAGGVYSDRVQSGGMTRGQQQRVLDERAAAAPGVQGGYGTI